MPGLLGHDLIHLSFLATPRVVRDEVHQLIVRLQHCYIDAHNRGENKDDVGVMYFISNALRTKILTKNGIIKY